MRGMEDDGCDCSPFEECTCYSNRENTVTKYGEVINEDGNFIGFDNANGGNAEANGGSHERQLSGNH